MPPSVVLVTGAGRLLGAGLAAALADHPGIDRVIGVDPAAPPEEADRTGRAGRTSRVGRVEFVRVDLWHPDLARLLDEARVDTVVHTGAGDDGPTPGDRPQSSTRARARETNVIGTLQLLAACQRSGHLRRLVVRSSAVVYGCTCRAAPALFAESDTEWDHPAGWLSSRDSTPPPRGGPARDALDVEGYLRAFGRRRPDVTVTVLRLAHLIGGRVRTPLTRYLDLPVVPTVAGFDPRLQFVHPRDAVEVFRLATVADRPPWAGSEQTAPATGGGSHTVNVAGPGVLTLSQAIRRAGRLALPVPTAAGGALAEFARRTGLADLDSGRTELLTLGGVMDTTRLVAELGFRPRFTSMDALDDHVRDRPEPRTNPDLVSRLTDRARRLVTDLADLTDLTNVADLTNVTRLTDVAAWTVRTPPNRRDTGA